MLEAYSTNITVAASDAVPFNNATVVKGQTAVLSAPATVQLNKCGVYMVSVDASASAAATIQLYKNGVAAPQAVATGTHPSFVTLVQVTENNTCCPCTMPTVLQVINTGDDTATLTNANIVITKVC